MLFVPCRRALKRVRKTFRISVTYARTQSSCSTTVVLNDGPENLMRFPSTLCAALSSLLIKLLMQLCPTHGPVKGLLPPSKLFIIVHAQ